MNSVLALVWTFTPFYSLQEAQAFMDKLSPTAEASISYGVAMTEEESKSLKESRDRIRREEKADRKKYEKCQELSRRFGQIRSDSKPKVVSGGYWTLGYGEDISKDGKILWRLECPYPMWSTTIISFAERNRWIVTYKAESNTAKKGAK